MTIPASFPFRILIVEDQKNWHGPMSRKLKILLPNAQIDVATNIEQARNNLIKTHYHFISLDQNMPEKFHSEVSVDFGSGFTTDLQKRHPCLGIGIYTGYFSSSEQGGKIGRVAGPDIPLWEKAIGSDGKSGISVETWAKNVAEWLSNNYIPVYFKLALNHLPCDLAGEAGHLANLFAEQTQEKSQTTVKHCFYFWNLILQLAVSQAMAIARDTNIHFEGPDNNRLETQEKTLESLTALLQQRHKIPFWIPYVGRSATSFLKNSRIMRDFRNKDSHQAPLDDYRLLLADITSPLLAIMDASAFWADFPFLTNIRAQANHEFRADLVKGNGHPWPTLSFYWQTDTKPNPDHIYLRYSNPYSNEIKLVDLWPFITKEYNQAINRPVLTLFSHRWRNDWYRVSLINGQPEKWDTIDNEAKTVLSAYYP